MGYHGRYKPVTPNIVNAVKYPNSTTSSPTRPSPTTCPPPSPPSSRASALPSSRGTSRSPPATPAATTPKARSAPPSRHHAIGPPPRNTNPSSHNSAPGQNFNPRSRPGRRSRKRTSSNPGAAPAASLIRPPLPDIRARADVRGRDTSPRRSNSASACRKVHPVHHQRDIGRRVTLRGSGTTFGQIRVP